MFVNHPFFVRQSCGSRRRLCNGLGVYGGGDDDAVIRQHNICQSGMVLGGYYCYTDNNNTAKLTEVCEYCTPKRRLRLVLNCYA